MKGPLYCLNELILINTYKINLMSSFKIEVSVQGKTESGMGLKIECVGMARDIIAAICTAMQQQSWMYSTVKTALILEALGIPTGATAHILKGNEALIISGEADKDDGVEIRIERRGKHNAVIALLGVALQRGPDAKKMFTEAVRVFTEAVDELKDCKDVEKKDEDVQSCKDVENPTDDEINKIIEDFQRKNKA